MDSKIIIAPSLLAADFGHLAREIRRVAEAGAEYLHLDVMDGHFVPNMSFGPSLIASLRSRSKLFFDVHLMISDPMRYIADFARAGADGITIHYESCENPGEVLRAIRALGCRAALSIKPATDASVVEPLMDELDMVLIMTVEPGFGGQKFMPDTMKSVSAVRQMFRDRGRAPMIQVDGGISGANAAIPAANGANIFVAGSAVFRADDPAAAVSSIRAAAESAYEA